ncbi:MAG: ATP-dependent Clp protease adaptor ClpS [Balneolaceae bacterium]|nr:MAG: ATP-dependent Clp protease adaptor ClpS [Balneolaceae bacterium]
MIRRYPEYAGEKPFKPVQKPEKEVLVDTMEEELLDTPWTLILYDDDIHTFEEVISQLIKALGCSVNRAEEITYTVHNEGKAVVYQGSFEECLKINSVLQEIQLITEIKG